MKLTKRAGSAVVIALLAACSPGTAGERDAGTDVRSFDADTAIEHDGGAEAADHDADTGPTIDGGCDFCGYGFCPDTMLCAAPAVLEPGAPLIRQDTANGGRGDCAVSASGWGGPNLYYSLTLPAGKYAHVVAAPSVASEPALLRVLPDCLATESETSDRGGDLTNGEARLCLRNDTSTDRTVVLAVGRYSGEEMNLTLVFDLSVDIVDPAVGCVP